MTAGDLIPGVVMLVVAALVLILWDRFWREENGN